MFKVNILSSVIFLAIGISANSVDASSLNSTIQTQNINNIETIVDGLFQPYGIASNNGNILVTTNGALLNIDPLGNVTTITPLATGIASGVIVSGSDIITVENATGSLLRISSTGNISTIATGLNDPAGVTQQGNDFIVGDFGFGTGRLLRVSADGNVSTIASTGLGGPTEIVVEGDNLWVTDFALGRLLKVSATGDITEIATGLGQPLDLVFDGKAFIITDFAQGFDTSGNGRILRVTKSGRITTLLQGIGNPSGITLDGSDLLYTDIVEGSVNRVEGFLQVSSVPEPSFELGILSLGILGLGKLLKSNQRNEKQ